MTDPKSRNYLRLVIGTLLTVVLVVSVAQYYAQDRTPSTTSDAAVL